MLTLPKDVIKYISTFLQYKDSISLELTSKYLRNSLETIWLNKVLSDYPNQMKYIPNIYKNLIELKILKILGFQSSTGYKKIYRLFMRKSKIISVKDFIDKIPNLDLRRGDVVRHGYVFYRNEGKYFWNGTKIIGLDFVKDDYGSVPNEFCFPEFKPDYFTESIEHNTYINFTEEKLKEMCNNFDPDTQMSYVTDRYNKYEIDIVPSRSFIKFSKILSSNVLMYYEKGKIKLEINTLVNERQDSTYITFPKEWIGNIIPIESVLLKHEWVDNTLRIIYF